MKDEDRSSLDTFHPSAFRLHPFAKRIHSQLLDLCGEFRYGERELATHSGGQVDHLDAAARQADLLQQLLRMFDSAAGV